MEQRRSFALALPDSEQVSATARKAASVASTRLNHRSGRPWLVAHVPDHVRIATVQANVAVAVIGQGGPTQDELERAAHSIRTLHDVARLQSSFPGSFSVFGALDGAIFANAPAAQTRRVFQSRVNGVPILSDRADALAHFADLPLDYVAVGARLSRGLPHPADDLPMWAGVSALPGPEYIIVEPTGQIMTRIWWTRPERRLSRADGAAALRGAMEESIRVRARDHDELTCDLSGGLDSTPLCYFASQTPGGIVARTFFTNDPGGREDLDWAKRALPAMPGVREHKVFSTDGLPGFYEGLYGLGVPLDEVTQAGGAIPRIRHMLTDDTERGIDMHLNGLGGDHLLRGVRAWNHTLAKTRPALAWSRARAEDAPAGVPARSTMRQLADRRSYSRWCREVIRDAENNIAPPELPRGNDWSVPLTLPSWLSDDGRNAVLDRLRETVTDAMPLAPTLAGHFDLFTVRQAGRLARSMATVGDAFEVAYESPLLDDRIVEAVLSVRYEERDTPVEWKPLMKEAMRGLLPDSYLRRTTKIGGAPQAVRGYAANYDRLRTLWEDADLLDSGIIDRTRLDEAAKPTPTSTPSTHIHALIDTAIFLQSQQSVVWPTEIKPQEPR